MKIYIEIEKEFYDYSKFSFEIVEGLLRNNGLQLSPAHKTEKRDFEIGARVYFENVGWTEVVENTDYDCEQCIFKNFDCWHLVCHKSGRLDGNGGFFKKFDLSEKQEEPKQTEQFYVLNTKTGVTNFIHESEESAKTEAERLASKQPGDTFRVLKVVGECVGKVNVEWKQEVHHE